MFVPATLVAILAIPLALRIVPPNRVYGYRTIHTLGNRDLWFRVNRVAGSALALASAVALSIYLRRPDLASGRSFSGVLVLVLPVIFALAATAIYVRRVVNRTG